MIAFLRGKVLYETVETVVLDINGIGYEVYLSGSARSNVQVGGMAEFYTYMQVKEDGIVLFGFSSIKEKELFLKLISVSGVGAKTGIAVLSSMNADEFATAIFNADSKRLSAVKGLGKKTAEKIILELHGKISAAEIMDANGDNAASFYGSIDNNKISPEDEDAIEALTGLGYKRNESVQAVRRARENGLKTTEEIIMHVLRSGV